VAVRFIFRAMAEERDRSAPREVLQQSQSKFLPVILDVAVSGVDPAPFVQFAHIATAILGPADFPGENSVPQFFARSEVSHPDVVTSLGEPRPRPRATRMRNPSRSGSIGVCTDFVRTIRYNDSVRR